MKEKREFILYVVTGGITTVLAWASYLAATRWVGLHYIAANVISFLFCNLFSFLTNKLLVFRKKELALRTIGRELIGFFGCKGVSFLFDTLVLFLGVTCLKQNDILIKIISSFFVVLINYTGNKKFVFPK